MEATWIWTRCISVPKGGGGRNRPPGGVSADLCSRRKRPCHHLPEEGSHVDGVLWSLTGDCEKSLDLYEGYPDFYDKQEITVKNKGGREIKAIVYIMTKDYMQNFNPPGRSYLTGILKGCRQNQIPTEPILKAARKPPVPGKTQKSQPKKQRKAGQER